MIGQTNLEQAKASSLLTFFWCKSHGFDLIKFITLSWLWQPESSAMRDLQEREPPSYFEDCLKQPNWFIQYLKLTCVAALLQFQFAGKRRKVTAASLYLAYDSLNSPPTQELINLETYVKLYELEHLIECDANIQHIY